MIGISSPSWGPNCRLTAEYLIAIGVHSFRLHVENPVIPTLPVDKTPSDAPNLLFGSLRK
jgi:hypothetical protein